MKSFSLDFDEGFGRLVPDPVPPKPYSSSPRRSQAVEDTFYRDPEWETIEPGYGQPPTMRTFEYDPVHGYFRSDGPVIEIKRPERPE